ncbi:GD15315 [Drosophila simulans]|uniref:GD15315 n=1 Tax=Drosophila simulans TaxID=7240 RepID=B4NS26_DROSI|nr:GD15315 [Drosophila simulans]
MSAHWLIPFCVLSVLTDRYLIDSWLPRIVLPLHRSTSVPLAVQSSSQMSRAVPFVHGLSALSGSKVHNFLFGLAAFGNARIPAVFAVAKQLS